MPERDTTPTEPRLWMWPGMMPILQASGVMTPGQFGPIRIERRAFERALHLHHVEHRDALGDADDELELGVDRLEDRVGRERRRHVDRGGGGAGLLLASATVLKTGRPMWVSPPLPGVTPPTILVP